MRKQLFYTAEEITNNLHTFGGELMYLDGTEYIGPYHLYSTGEIYTGATWSSKQSIELTGFVKRDVLNNVYRSLKTINIKTTSIQSHTVNITKSDISNGFVDRYFLKKVNEEIIIEVSDKTYKKWTQGTIDKKLYSGVKIKWHITGNIEDKFNGSVLERGVFNSNNRQIKAAQATIPTINNVLNNPLQLYVDIDFVVASDINDSAI